MVDDVGRVGVGREQRLQDLGMEPPAGRGRDARADRVTRELVAEADVGAVDLEQLPALGLLRRHRPVGHDGVEDGGADAAGHDRYELDQRRSALSRRAARPRTAFATVRGIRFGAAAQTSSLT